MFQHVQNGVRKKSPGKKTPRIGSGLGLGLSYGQDQVQGLGGLFSGGIFSQNRSKQCNNYQFNCKHLLIVSNLNIVLLNLKMPKFFCSLTQNKTFMIFFLLQNLCSAFLQQWFIILFCKSNFIVMQPPKRYVGQQLFKKIVNKKLTSSCSFCNIRGCKDQILM